MAKWGKCDYSQLEKLQKKMDKMQKNDFDVFCQKCAKNLAARLLRLVIQATPKSETVREEIVDAKGKRTLQTVKNGGTLQRGWTAKGEKQAVNGGNPGADVYAASLPVVKKGDTYHVTVYNPVHYASYVEFGHRRVNGGWTEGKLMLTKSEIIIEQGAPKMLERKIKKYMEECLSAE